MILEQTRKPGQLNLDGSWFYLWLVPVEVLQVELIQATLQIRLGPSMWYAFWGLVQV